MAGEIIYADLNIGPGKRCRKQPSLPQPGILHQQSENPGSCKNGSGNREDGNITLESFRSELRKDLCSSKPQEGKEGKLCPAGWTLHRTKCYWVADRNNPWSKSREDCVNRGAELLMPADQDELDFVNELVQKPDSYFWIGLSIPSTGKGWTWLNGSCMDESWFQLRPGDEGRSCGVVKENRIYPRWCRWEFPWICQKDTIQL
ncbi:killer cell lectin-like receptor subfamily B member 1B allele C [Phoenicopterus ruber ruber]